MKAIGYQTATPELNASSLIDIELPTPTPTGRDLLVEVKAISANPVDTKVRRGMSAEDGGYKILGWDAVGVVKAVGSDVSLFAPGDRVYYAGDITRSGSNAEYQLVDERIVAHAPSSLNDAEAAAIPLTAITAWELLFERVALPLSKQSTPYHLLVVGGAGGVGSILLQLAALLTNVTIIATASRESTQAWAKSMGAHHVIDHHGDMPAQLSALGIPHVDCVISLTNTDDHFDALIEMLKPQGKLALIDDPDELDVKKMKRKSLSLHWELMFTRPVFETEDMIEQHKLLSQVASLIDKGLLKTTLGQHLGTINAENLMKAHEILESQSATGKLVLAGF